MDRLAEIKAALHRCTWSPTMAPIHDIDWLVAEVERLREVERAARELVDVVDDDGWLFTRPDPTDALDALRAALATPAPVS